MGAEERPAGVAKGEFPGQSENVFQVPQSSAFMAGGAVAVTQMDTHELSSKGTRTPA